VKISIDWTYRNRQIIHDIVMDKKYVYILIKYFLFLFNHKGEKTEYYRVASFPLENNHGKITLDGNEIYVFNEANKNTLVFSTNGKITRLCDFSRLFTKFDMYKNYIYVLDDNILKIFTKTGEMIYNKTLGFTDYRDLIVIEDNLYIVRKTKIHVFKIIFFNKNLKL
jgi:hypothetical protein